VWRDHLSATPGDYNHNGVVDAADYTIWRDTFGRTVTTGTGADGNANGTIDNADYGLWKSHFGPALPGAGSDAGRAGAVSEPSNLILLLAAAACLAVIRLRLIGSAAQKLVNLQLSRKPAI
ncbi:MAG TPA: dockerin type I domain-containing protein, partial [Lacipirellulaceae bacterium]